MQWKLGMQLIHDMVNNLQDARHMLVGLYVGMTLKMAASINYKNSSNSAIVSSLGPIK